MQARAMFSIALSTENFTESLCIFINTFFFASGDERQSVFLYMC